MAVRFDEPQDELNGMEAQSFTINDDGGSDVFVSIEADDKPYEEESLESSLGSNRFLPQLLHERVALYVLCVNL